MDQLSWGNPEQPVPGVGGSRCKDGPSEVKKWGGNPSKLIYRLEVRIVLLMVDLAKKTSRAAKAAVRTKLHNDRCWEHSALTVQLAQTKAGFE